MYRGSNLPGLTGRYIFADWSREFFGNNGRLFHIVAAGQMREFNLQNPVDMSPLGFGLDTDGEIYLMVNSTGTPSGGTGIVYRLDPSPSAACAG